jgi:dihydropteroate synthase
MGILNVTPDSFSDAGCFFHQQAALDRACVMIEEGADIIDIGGASSRPGAQPVSTEEELARVIPVIERLHAISDICISIDTDNAVVMSAAVHAGAGMINDIRALRAEHALSTAAGLNVPICLMHMQGNPATMQHNPSYTGDVIDEINQFFRQRIHACEQFGIPPQHMILDPGFGFGKSVHHNLLILKRLAEFNSHRRPILLGVSRKNTLGVVLQKSVSERLSAGLAAAVYTALQGVGIMRTHDVSETVQALSMLDAIVQVDIDAGL